MKFTSYEIKKIIKDFKNRMIKCVAGYYKFPLLNPTFYIYSITHRPPNVYFYICLVVYKNTLKFS